MEFLQKSRKKIFIGPKASLNNFIEDRDIEVEIDKYYNSKEDDTENVVESLILVYLGLLLAHILLYLIIYLLDTYFGSLTFITSQILQKQCDQMVQSLCYDVILINDLITIIRGENFHWIWVFCVVLPVNPKAC